MRSLTPQYDWSTLDYAECDTTSKNFEGIRSVKRQAIGRGVAEFAMQLNAKGKKDVPGLVLAYWRDLDRAFNSAYMDVTIKLVDRAMANRAMMSSRVQQIADAREKYDEAWCYEWEDCHTRSFVLSHGDTVPKSLFRALNQRRSVLSGAATERKRAVFNAKIGPKEDEKNSRCAGNGNECEPLDL
jgi:hypothetical protein